MIDREKEELLNSIYYKLAKPDKTIVEHTNDLIVRADRLLQLGYIYEDIYKLLLCACKFHDIGKANEEFQKRINNKKLLFDPDKEVAHNILSLVLTPDISDEIDKDDYFSLLFAIVYHHNYDKEIFDAIENKKDLILKLLEPYEPLINKKIFLRSSRKKINESVKRKETVLLKGLLHKCDYAASGEYEIEYENNFLLKSLRDLLNRWNNNSNIVNVEWNEMQNYCKERENKNIIVAGSTGMGKTEAALLWLGNNKGFYILPIRTAINSMYDRICNEILCNDNIYEKISLLHSESLEQYILDARLEDVNVIEYNDRGRNLSMPLTISTLDQLFDFVFKYQGYELKLATLSYSKIIIDEIQMYGPDLLAYLICGLKQINKMGGKVAILTATFPPFMRDLMLEIDFEYKEFYSDLIRHNVKIINDKISVREIVEKYNQNIKENKSNKILVLCNTIKGAQQLYENLACEFGTTENIHLLHSKFIRNDRSIKEKEITMCGQSQERSNNIWISTSLVEASLDIDFDFLFTELQDLNSLFQRMGRCNRKGKKETDDFNCYIYTEIEANQLINGNRGFIDKTIYELSKKAIYDEELGLNGLVTEKQKTELLNKYFSTENIKESDFMNDYYEISRYIERLRIYEVNEKKEMQIRNILNIDVIPAGVYEENRERIYEIKARLQSNNLDYRERKVLETEIKGFSLPVYLWEYKEYLKAVKKGNARAFSKIKINKYCEIPVIECEYDNVKGYTRLNFKEKILEAEIW